MLRPGQRLLVAPAQDPPQGGEPLQTEDADEEAEAMPSQHLADLSIAAGRRLRSDVSSLASGACRIGPRARPRRNAALATGRSGPRPPRRRGSGPADALGWTCR